MNYNCERCGDHLGWREHQGPTLCERCRLRAEVERLRTALEAIVQVDEISAGESWEDAFYDVAGIARAALAKEEE